MILSTLVRERYPLTSPWHPLAPTRGPREKLARGVWVLRTKRWAHASTLDRHSELPAPVVDVEEALRMSWYVADWHGMALCAGMPFAAFFGADNDERPTMKRSEISAARRICASCPVTRECLDWSLSQGEAFGVWGGTSGRQRARMRAEMRAGVARAEVVDKWLSSWLTTTT